MNVDDLTMIIYTVATIAFTAGRRHPARHGAGTATSDMIPILSNIYTETLGGWAKWLFYVGAIVVLYGTIFAATAGHSRMFADFMRLQGAFSHDDLKARNRWRDIFIVVLTVIPVVLYFIFGERPVAMVKWGGFAQAWTLPIISFGTVYLVHRYLPREMHAKPVGTVLLWVGATSPASSWERGAPLRSVRLTSHTKEERYAMSIERKHVGAPEPGGGASKRGLLAGIVADHPIPGAPQTGRSDQIKLLAECRTDKSKP